MENVEAVGNLESVYQSLSEEHRKTHNSMIREITLEKRPRSLLCKLMTRLESMRAARGLGWSRPWNKVDLNVFETHVYQNREDRALLQPLQQSILTLLEALPSTYKEFFQELIDDPKPMFFVFYHNRSVEGVHYEGLTLSFGRRVVNDKSKRDRFDIVLEDRVEGVDVDGQLDLVRIYNCPWSDYQTEQQHELHTYLGKEIPEGFQELYETALTQYNQWKDLQERSWSHWSTKYIEYFGQRTFVPNGTVF